MTFHTDKSVDTLKVMVNFPSHGHTFCVNLSRKVDFGIVVNSVNIFKRTSSEVFLSYPVYLYSDTINNSDIFR